MQRIINRQLWVAVGVLVLMWSVASAEVLDVYFLRHAQTMANVTREYTEENQRTFSPRGEEQVAGIVEKLADLNFDVVLVSPAYRAQQTILPFLKEHGIQAEIWPELYECCWDYETEDDEPELVRGDRIELDEAERAYFRFRDEDSVYLYNVDTPARGELMIERAVELILSRFAGTGQTILLVSHYHTGSRLMPALMGEPPPRGIRPGNARLTHIRQEADGRFRLLMVNDIELR